MDQAGANRHRDAVDRDSIRLGVDAAAQLGDVAVDRDPAGRDQLLTRPPAAEAPLGEHLLEAFPLGGVTGQAGCRRPRLRHRPDRRWGPVRPEAVLQGVHDLRAGNELGQRRQLLDAVEPEPLQEQRGGAVQHAPGPGRDRGPPRR